MKRQPGQTDTSPEAEEIIIRIYRNMPAWRKIQLVDDANRTARQLALAGLRSRYPQETESRHRRRLYGLLLGEKLAHQAYGPLEETG